MGNFNYPDTCWEAHSAKYSPSKKLLTCIADSFLLQKEEEETRRLALLDLILTNRDDVVDEEAGRETLEVGGHVILRFLISKDAKAV